MPPGVSPATSLACGFADSHPLLGTKSFPERRPPPLLVLYTNPKVRPWPVDLLAVIIRQIAGGKRGIILSADTSPVGLYRTGLGYRSLTLKSTRTAFVLSMHYEGGAAGQQRLVAPCTAPPPLLLALLRNNFTHQLHSNCLNQPYLPKCRLWCLVILWSFWKITLYCFDQSTTNSILISKNK